MLFEVITVSVSAVEGRSRKHAEKRAVELAEANGRPGVVVIDGADAAGIDLDPWRAWVIEHVEETNARHAVQNAAAKAAEKAAAKK